MTVSFFLIKLLFIVLVYDCDMIVFTNLKIKSMKKTFILFVATCFFVSFTAIAQNAPRNENRQFSPNDRAEQMAKDLNLNDNQKQQVKVIFEEQQTQMQALRQNEGLSQDQRREKMTTIRQNSDKKIEEAIGKENFEKYKTLMNERMKARRDNRGPRN